MKKGLRNEDYRFQQTVAAFEANYYDAIASNTEADLYKGVLVTATTAGAGDIIMGLGSSYNAVKVARMTSLLGAASEDANLGRVSLQSLYNIGQRTGQVTGDANFAMSIGSLLSSGANVGINLAASNDVQDMELAIEGGIPLGSTALDRLNVLANTAASASASLLNSYSNPAVPNIAIKAHGSQLNGLLDNFKNGIDKCRCLTDK